METDKLPLYTISAVAQLTGISPRMLREYEMQGFIRPHRIKNRRLFSNNDIRFIEDLKFYLKDKKMSIAGLKEFYRRAPCWEIKRCGMQKCPAYGNFSKMCWEVTKYHKRCNSSLCCSCPIYLIKVIQKAQAVRKNSISPLTYDEKSGQP
jgi:MerR family transcriptional regulator/heat shock protein HspR